MLITEIAITRFMEQSQTCDLIDVGRVGYLKDSADQPVSSSEAEQMN